MPPFFFSLSLLYLSIHRSIYLRFSLSICLSVYPSSSSSAPPLQSFRSSVSLTHPKDSARTPSDLHVHLIQHGVRPVLSGGLDLCVRLLPLLEQAGHAPLQGVLPRPRRPVRLRVRGGRAWPCQRVPPRAVGRRALCYPGMVSVCSFVCVMLLRTLCLNGPRRTLWQKQKEVKYQ